VAPNGEDVARVRNQLDRAIESLALRPTDGGGVDHLREAARLLEGIRLAAGREPLTFALAPALRDLQTRAARAGQLFDAAAAFHRGWFEVTPAPAEGYTPEGVWAAGTTRSAAADSLSLEA
jgi:hypothetical protein